MVNFPAQAGDMLAVKLDTVDIPGGTVQFKATEVISVHAASQQEQSEQAVFA